MSQVLLYTLDHLITLATSKRFIVAKVNSNRILHDSSFIIKFSLLLLYNKSTEKHEVYIFIILQYNPSEAVLKLFFFPSCFQITLMLTVM